MTADKPYAGKGSGWAGSETSRARQVREDESGVTGKRQAAVYAEVGSWGKEGMTCAEVEAVFEIGHGPASAALTKLHKARHLRRLTEVRNGQQVYVVAMHVDGRPESPYRPNRAVGTTPEDIPSGVAMSLIVGRAWGEDGPWRIGVPHLYSDPAVAEQIRKSRTAKNPGMSYKVIPFTIPT